jgi:hypothetical protein
MGNTSTKTSFGSIDGRSGTIRPGYYISKSKVLYDGKVIPLEDLSTFKKLKYGYAKTDFHVYYKGKIIIGADPKTFTVINRESVNGPLKRLNSVIATDSGNVYQFGTKLNTNI